MNFLLDATLGMLIIWLAVKLTSKLVEYKQWTLLLFGEYGEFMGARKSNCWPPEGGVNQPSAVKDRFVNFGHDSRIIFAAVHNAK